MSTIDAQEYGHSVRESVGDWLERMAVGLADGRFRFCASRSLVPTRGHAGQFATCFAMKIAWSIGLWNKWPLVRRDACTAFVQSFQEPGGQFVDRIMLRRIVLGNVIGGIYRPRLSRMPRCRTFDSRQSARNAAVGGNAVDRWRAPKTPRLLPLGIRKPGERLCPQSHVGRSVGRRKPCKPSDLFSASQRGAFWRGQATGLACNRI